MASHFEFLSYEKLNPQYNAFISNGSSLAVPKNIQEAMGDPKWREAVYEEMKALKKNDTWVLSNLPAGKKTVRCKLVFTIKFKADGKIERYKARLVAKGYTQTWAGLSGNFCTSCKNEQSQDSFIFGSPI